MKRYNKYNYKNYLVLFLSIFFMLLIILLVKFGEDRKKEVDAGMTRLVYYYLTQKEGNVVDLTNIYDYKITITKTSQDGGFAENGEVYSGKNGEAYVRVYRGAVGTTTVYYTVNFSITPKTGYYIANFPAPISDSTNAWSSGTNSTEYKYIHVGISPNTYNISYNLNGGNKSGSYWPTTATYDSAFNVSNPIKTGYNFNGWTATGLDTSTAKYGSTNGSATNSWTNGSTMVYSGSYMGFNNLTSKKNGTVTLIANWSANGYTLTADANGGTIPSTSGWNVTGSTATKSVKYDSTYGTLPTPTRTGYIFAGWWTENTGGAQVSSSTKMDNVNGKTIYAHWTANTYTVNFNGNGNTGGSMTSQSFTYDTGQNLKANAFTKTGYTFAGWATSANGGVVYSNGQWVNNLTPTNGGVVTLYAKWTANSYNIVFNANGGSGEMDDLSMIYDTPKTLSSNTFTRQGYYFVGWSKDKKGVQETIPTSGIYKDGASVNNLVTSGSITLYAVWLDTWANHVTQPTGSGMSNNPYIIDSAEDLAWMINNHGGVLKYYKQTQTINLSGRAWFGIGTSESQFKGVYNGQGYEITNLQIPEIRNSQGENIQSNVGLFGYCSGAEITGVYLKNASVNGKENVGLIAGYSSSTKIHSNIIENGSITGCTYKVKDKEGDKTIHGKYGAIAGNISGGEIKFNLAYITTSGGTSINGLYNGSATLSTNLIEKDGTRVEVGTREKVEGNENVIAGWGKVSNRLLPTEISWGAQVLSATSADFTNWINKTLN